ncbi:MAG: acyl-CoA dehydrogenase [SAR202 cluster bacterium]|nr:acyl-CoA dehydrogenase [SAR202 cluster bacterium]
MDFRFAPEEEAFRAQVKTFIRDVLPPDWEAQEGEGYGSPEAIARTKATVKKVAERGWLTMAWPREYGGMAAPHMQQMVFQEEAAYHSLPTDAGVGAVSWVAPVLMRYGTEEQKQQHLTPIARGERFWCTLYSEPGTGSDLAGLQTRAVRDGDEYVINGSKIWTSAGHVADYGWLAARTDPDAPKHRGISLFLLDMKSPGVTVRPVINMAGVHSFNQVYFDNVRVPAVNLVGEENRGWYTVAVALDFERSGVGRSASARRVFEQMLAYAKETERDGAPIAGDPIFRNRFVEMSIEIEVSRWLSYQIAWMQSRNLVPNKEASIAKLFGSEVSQHLYGLGMDMLGMFGQLEKGSKWAPLHGKVMRGYLSAFSATIGAGTSEIQRNIIATRGLGLPRG